MAKKGLLSRFRSDSSDSLSEEENLKKELMELKMQLDSGQLSQTHKIKDTRRTIAQLKTVVRKKSKASYV